MARLSAYIPEQRELGFDRGNVWIAPDFDDPLPDGRIPRMTFTLPPHHPDPFDRLLVAQAQLERMSIVSSDRALMAYDVEVIAP